MSVSRRVILSVGCLMLLALGALGYQLWGVYQLQQINNELAELIFAAGRQLSTLQRDGEEVENLAKKYVVSPSQRAELRRGVDDRVELFERDLSNLVLLFKGKPPEAVVELSAAWNHLKGQIQEKIHDSPIDEKLDELPPELYAAIGDVLSQIETVRTTEEIRIDLKVASSRLEGRQAAAFSLIAGTVFLLLGGLMAYFTVRSITIPLGELTRGTRSVAEGQFSHRLPVKGPLEFAEVARDFNAMSERLGELDQMKKDFVSHVSHELKAPLAAIRQTLAVALEQLPGPLNEQQSRLLNLSRQSAERLSAMVANLLDVSKLEAGTMDYEMTQQDLVKLVRSVVDEFSLNAAECRVSLSVVADPPGIPVVCDRDRLIQVVGNLIDNALKFCPAGSTIVVNLLGRPEERGGFVRLSVADTGPGVADAHKRDIFEKFHQVRGGRRMLGQGVGLGLAICKTIVDAHSGRIWVEDNPGGGSVFCVELPATVTVETMQCS